MKYLTMGDGPERIVWLHGGNVAGWMWGQQVPAFSDYTSIVVDLPGFGASNDERWVSVAASADRVAELIEGPAHLVGLSLGSSVALEVAARHPELVSSLFLASTQATPPRRRDMLAARALLLFWNQRGFWQTTAKAYGLTGDDAELFIETGLGIRRETAIAIYDEVCNGIPDATLAALGTLHARGIRALAVAGDRDSPAIWRDSLSRLRNAGGTVATAPGMHHQWNIENVELFNSALREWLTTRKAAATLGSKI